MNTLGQLSMQSEPKQVIVMRKDLNMRKGKMVAQGAHASMGVLLHMMGEPQEGVRVEQDRPLSVYRLYAEGYVRDWLKGRFTKICVSVNSEQELLDIYRKAQDEGIPCVLITDSGLTEFNGVPTNTCVGIGPWKSEDIDAITGDLKLL